MAKHPAFLRIADEIRQSIKSETLASGDRLPSNPELAELHQVSLMTIRKAIDVLKNEGLIETKTRGGTVVRVQPVVHRISSARYLVDAGSQETPRTSFTSDHGIRWDQYRLDKIYRWTETDDRLAGLFGVDVGVRVLERRFVFYADGEPTQLSRPYMLASDVEGTPIEDPANEPWPGGTIAQLRSIGIVVDDIKETVAGRMPSSEEVELLGIGSGVPVFSITRRMFSRGRVVEVADPIVVATNSHVLDYDIPF